MSENCRIRQAVEGQQLAFARVCRAADPGGM